MVRPTWRGGPHLPSRGLPLRTQLEALRDQRKPLSTHYGALLGLAVLGPLAVHKLVMPILPGYLQTLQPLLEPPMAPMDGAPADGAASSAAGATAKKGAALARSLASAAPKAAACGPSGGFGGGTPRLRLPPPPLLPQASLVLSRPRRGIATALPPPAAGAARVMAPVPVLGPYQLEVTAATVQPSRCLTC